MYWVKIPVWYLFIYSFFSGIYQFNRKKQKVTKSRLKLTFYFGFFKYESSTSI